DVGLALAGLEDGDEAALGAPQLQELGALVVAEELGEVLDEAGVGEERPALGGGDGIDVEPILPLLEAMEAEDVRDRRLLAQSQEDVEAEEQMRPDRDDVAGQAVVLRPRALVADDAELGATEELLAPFVERLRLLPHGQGLGEEACTDHLIAAALGSFDLGGGLRFVRHLGRRPLGSVSLWIRAW